MLRENGDNFINPHQGGGVKCLWGSRTQRPLS